MNAARQRCEASVFPLMEIRMQRAAAKVHRLGPRVVFEIFAEVVGRWPLKRREAFLARLETYAALDPETLRALGGDAFPTQPLREVRP